MDLKSKKIIVTGGAAGIGKCLVHALVSEGSIVAVLDKNVEALEKLRNEIEGVCCQPCDVSNVQDVEKSVHVLYQKLNDIDVLVNNVGFFYNSPLISFTSGAVKKHDVSMWHEVVRINMDSVFYMTSHVVEKMVLKRTKGVVVNVSSICASGNAGQSAYSAAKAAVNALTVTWAKELSLIGIRVVGIAPGFVETESTKQAMTESVLKEWIRKIPLRRFGTPEEITSGIISILRNDFFNGKVFELDGGLILGT